MLVALLVAALTAQAAPRDQALELLAQKRTSAAVAALERGISQGEGDELACLLAEIQLLEGDAAGALRTASGEDLDCALQAAWLRAEALAALGRLDEAAAQYAGLGAAALGSDRGQITAEQLARFAERLLEKKPAEPQAAGALLALAVQQPISEARALRLARRLADVSQEHGVSGRAAIPRLSREVAHSNAPADRIRLAHLLGGAAGREMLAPLPDSAAIVSMRLALSADLPLDAALVLTRQLVESWPGAPETLAAQWATGSALLADGRVTEATALLAPLAEGFDERAAQASWKLLEHAVRAGDAADALARSEDFIARFPGSSLRIQAEEVAIPLRMRAARAAAERGDHAEAIGRYDALVRDLPRDGLARTAALEAALAVRASGDLDGARERLERMAVRWAGSHEATEAIQARFFVQAIDQDDTDGAVAWMEREAAAEADTSARQVWAELQDVALSVEGPPGITSTRAAAVTVHSQNLDEVEVRLHRIDSEAYLRDGGTLSGLSELDIEIIAPDRRWTAPVPDARDHQPQSWSLPVPVSSPGLYAVTVATTDRTAQTFLYVSDTRLLVRRTHETVLVGVLQGERPAPGARVFIESADGVQEIQADRTGLARVADPGGALTLLALPPSGPAMLSIEEPTSEAPSAALPISVDLDRPAYRPGDPVQFRLTPAPHAQTGPWVVWLESGETTVRHTFTPGFQGTVVGALVTPVASVGSSHGLPLQRTVELWAIPPWSEQPQQLATVNIADPIGAGRQMSVHMDGDDAVIRVVEDDGRPVEGALVSWSTPVSLGTLERKTDATGQIRVSGPPGGMPWSIDARWQKQEASASRSRAGRVRPAVRLAQDHLRAAERGTVVLTGDGDVELLVYRHRHAPPEPVVSDPWRAPIAWGLRTYPQPAPDAEAGWRELVARIPASLEGALELALPALEAGTYSMVARTPDGQLVSPEVSLAVSASPRLGELTASGVGETLSAGVQGALSLVTVRAGQELVAALLPPGRTLSAPIGARWPSVAWVEAIHADGTESARAVSITNTPSVELSVEPAGADWRVTATVTDSRGRPMDAQVVLRATDPQLERWAGRVQTSRSGPMVSDETPETLWASMIGLSHAAASAMISPRLLEERAIQEERRKALRAQEGRLTDNALYDLLMSPQGIAIGAGGLGSRGSGLGGGGYASGMGSMGSRGSGRIRGQKPLPGFRGAALWSVLQTGADGTVSVTVPRPQHRARWRVDAIAVTEGRIGKATQQVRTDDLPVLLLAQPDPAPADAVASPIARVVNGSDAEAQVTVTVDGAPTALSIPAGQVASVPLGDRVPGSTVPVTLEAGELSASVDWAWDLQPWAPTASGLETIAVGPAGAPPAAWIAKLRDPWAGWEPQRAAVEARSLLAVLPHLTGSDRAEALARVESLLITLPTSYRTVTGAAQAMAALAEASDVLDVSGDAIAQIDGNVKIDGATLGERTMLLWARTRAGRPVSDASVARLLRQVDEMSDEERAMLARALHALERPTRDLIRGQGEQAILARREILRRPPAETAQGVIPSLGSARRPDWIAALSAPKRPLSQDIPVQAGGQPLGQLSASAGGTLSSSAPIQVPDTPAPVVVVRAPALPDAPSVQGVRLPRSVTGRHLTNATQDPQTATEPIGCSPCTIGEGEALRLRVSLVGLSVPGGLRVLNDRSGTLVQGAVPGRYVIRGMAVGLDQQSTLEVTVGAPGDEMLDPAVSVTMAQEALAEGRDPTPWLAGRPRLDDWAPGMQALIADLRFVHAVETGAGVVAAFEDLRDLSPARVLLLDEVAATARAYAKERPSRAIALWEAAIDAAFLQEAVVVRQVQSKVGPLAGVQVFWGVARRYPRVPAVEAALFDLPDRLLDIGAGGLPSAVKAQGATRTDVLLMASAWSREFVLLNPDSDWAPLAGLRLAASLLALDAPGRAADWAQRIISAHPDHHLEDRLLYVEGLARAAMGQEGRALQRLEQVVDGTFATPGGQRAPSMVRDDAALAAARVREADGALRSAADAYAQVDGTFSEAQASLTVLQRRELSTGDLLVAEGGAPMVLEMQAVGIAEVSIRAYALDLRTLFLRDGSLQDAYTVQVAGVAPVWQGSRRVKESPFQRPVELRLPLSKPGAYLVQIEGGGQRASVLALRSDLTLDVVDAGDVRRVTALRRGRPAEGVEVRAITSHLVAARTDPRGVALVPAFAPTIVYDGEHLAFSPIRDEHATASAEADELRVRLEADLKRLREQSRAQLSHIGARQPQGVKADTL